MFASRGEILNVWFGRGISENLTDYRSYAVCIPNIVCYVVGPEYKAKGCSQHYTAVDMVVPKSFPALCTPYVQVVHQPWKCTVHKSWKCLHRGSVQEVTKSCKKCQECVQECVT